MAFDRRGLDDYVDVYERIAEFKDKYPNGSLQSEVVKIDITPEWDMDEIVYDRDGNEKGRGVMKLRGVVVMKGYAYRSPDDLRPGMGTSQLQLPGPTPYTKDSEIENCETSAWGRAIAALGIAVKRGIATKEEIQNKHESTETAKPACPKCGKTGTIIKSKPQYGGGWYCFPKLEGCGASFKEEPKAGPVVPLGTLEPGTTLTDADLGHMVVASGVSVPAASTPKPRRLQMQMDEPPPPPPSPTEEFEAKVDIGEVLPPATVQKPAPNDLTVEDWEWLHKEVKETNANPTSTAKVVGHVSLEQVVAKDLPVLRKFFTARRAKGN